jgi:predicted CopG family antitoxin
MTQKTISLNENSYKQLKKLKKKNESYSDLIIRLCNLRNPVLNDPLLEFSGIFSEDEELWVEIEKIIQNHRKSHLTNEIIRED